MEGAKSAKKQLNLSEIYLALYNIIQAIGWLIILLITVQTALTWTSQDDLFTSRNLYKNTEFFLIIFQTAALLEVVHAAIGLVRSNPIVVLMQVLSRLIVVWLVMYRFEMARNSVGVLICCLAWSFAEITRYLYYALNILEKIPKALTFLRYSLFIILYPIGITGELICIYQAVSYLSPMAIRRKYSFLLPNNLNISLDMCYLFIIVMLLYIPIFPQLYLHMFSQRRKILGGHKQKAKKKAQ